MEENVRNLINELNGNLDEYTPIPFWFINDGLTKEELGRQLKDFKAKGVNGVVFHPRIGIPKELKYLSEEYFDLVKYTVKTASELNMKIVLYDEGMYPSGSANGEVVRSNPDFAAVGITLSDSCPENGVVIAAKPKDGKYIVEKPCGGTIRGIHFGQDDGEPDAPKAADILNPKAVEKFIELTHERYYSHLSEYFENTVIGFFTDEPNVLGRNSRGFLPWSKGLLADFTAAGGNPDSLWTLFSKEEVRGKKEKEEAAFYREFIKQRLNNVYYKRLSDWCAAHGIALMGHPAESADIDEEKYFHIPGQDLVFRWVSPERGGTKGKDSVMAKCSADAARHMGRRRNSNECFGVCVRNQIPWYFTGGDMKWFIDYLAVRGVNLFIPHAFYYSLAGKRKEERPPDVGPGNIWWEHYKLFSDYMKRVSYIMTDSKNCAKIAVFCESGDMPVEGVEPFYENQIEFNYLQRSLLDKCEIRDGKVCMEGYEYEYVYGKSDSDTDKRLESAGVKRITDAAYFVGESKWKCDNGNLTKSVRDVVTESFCPNLRVTHIIKNGVSVYFVVNEGAEPISDRMFIREKCNVAEYDLWTGRTYCVPQNSCSRQKLPSQHSKLSESSEISCIELELAPRESRLFICIGEECGDLEQRTEKVIIDLTKEAVLVNEDKLLYKKTYVAEYNTEEITGNEVIGIMAEEMVECFCNGKFAGVSFWCMPNSQHRFEGAAGLLKKGRNEIKFVITGNAANRYTDNDIPYGIERFL